MQCQTPFRLTAILRSKSSSLSSCMGEGLWSIPALLTTTSRPPSVSTAKSNNARTSSPLVTSTFLKTILLPAFRPCWATDSPISSAISPITTFAPRLASSSALAAPMPDAPPVIKIRLPVTSDAIPFVFSVMSYSSTLSTSLPKFSPLKSIISVSGNVSIPLTI